MRSSRAILSLKYTPVGATAARAVGGFLRYVQYRDHHERPEDAKGVEGLTRYVAFRDKASPQGRLFNADRTVGDRERRQLVEYVRRSTANRRPRTGAPARAVYRLVLSPEDARGLDLRAVARATMDQLALDAGGLPPWIAAEHRNTAHPHVHVVLPAFREVAPGRFRQLVISKPRLAAMKRAMAGEIGRQRGERLLEPTARNASRRARHDQLRSRRRRRSLPPLGRTVIFDIAGAINRLAARYRQMLAEQEAERRRRERELGWER